MVLGNRKKSCGVSFIEAAISIPILLAILFFLIEACWYLYSTVALEHWAFYAVDKVSKAAETAIYTDRVSCTDNPTACADFKRKLDEIVSNTMRKAGVNTENSSITLHTFEMQSDSPAVTTEAKVAIIRPGERVRDLTTGNWIEHPVRKSGGCDPLKNVGLPCTTRGETWPSVLNNNTVATLMIADVHTLTPVFFGKTFTIQAMQMGVWRGPPAGDGSVAPTMPPLPTVTFTPLVPTVPPPPTIVPPTSPPATVTPTVPPTPTPPPVCTPPICMAPREIINCSCVCPVVVPCPPENPVWDDALCVCSGGGTPTPEPQPTEDDGSIGGYRVCDTCKTTICRQILQGPNGEYLGDPIGNMECSLSSYPVFGCPAGYRLDPQDYPCCGCGNAGQGYEPCVGPARCPDGSACTGLPRKCPGLCVNRCG